ncbi:uncharacterized protein LOC119769255 isoform X1 [Culex quinquefasciatus]|uniref:uncharacterized protein LOC120429177 n=1 Tax=Culex pipiens pallens TaxID=42434 RepID=UPI0018E2A631|nr:uncharacterized protein LOC119769255 isoform X1 [Culex quinquefasciatus]XP_039450324.1 uncharacterized protein LOC120429177 [Culex pipiens pallens]
MKEIASSAPEEEVPKPPAIVSYAFEKEIINRANAHIRVTDSFMPDVRRVPIAIKFWSKYDSTSEEAQRKLANVHKYVELLEKNITEGPREKYQEPRTENQCYGWHSGAVDPLVTEDAHLLYHPKKRQEITLIGEKINADKITQRPRFTGIPFKLPS